MKGAAIFKARKSQQLGRVPAAAEPSDGAGQLNPLHLHPRALHSVPATVGRWG